MNWNLGINKGFTPIKLVNPKINRYFLRFSKVSITPTEDNHKYDIKYLLAKYDGKITEDVLKKILISFIKEYDKSNDVNCVLIDNDKTWFDKETRTDLINSLKIKKEIGKTDTVLWYKVDEELKSVNLTIDKCLEFLYKLVIYGDKTYNVTQNHIKTINELTTIDELMSYNITTDYPAYIKLTTKTE